MIMACGQRQVGNEVYPSLGTAPPDLVPQSTENLSPSDVGIDGHAAQRYAPEDAAGDTPACDAA